MSPPTVFVPPSIKQDVENLIELHRKMGDVELNLDLVALDIGETYELRNDLVVRPFKTHHVIPSQGYVIYSVRKKLKKQYLHLKGREIEKKKKSGVEATFLDEKCDVEHAREHGHMHIDEEIRQAVTKLQAKVPAKVVPLTEIGCKQKCSLFSNPEAFDKAALVCMDLTSLRSTVRHVATSTSNDKLESRTSSEQFLDSLYPYDIG
ncbi:hypothetical protein E3N88_45929 [Mikania micrantha]|uniref:Uncharacterized protein n=1 Tax=Mikania micrantha TaxID=192012 RepID=A0A5N6L7P1_9ASTR|nr:hypothetical protein E3N88_45929 [Mikania micrantha]